MNRQQAKELLPIIEAFAAGEIIQIKGPDNRWYDRDKEECEIQFNSDPQMYRIKPKYRPFRSKEECWQEMLKHQPFGWVKEDVDNCNIVFIGRYGLSLNTGVGNDYYDYKKSF